jgi:hypothetical protein
LDFNSYTHATSIADLNANQSSAEIFTLLGSSSEIILLIEDLRGGGDEDFNDLVFHMTIVAGVPVPEPSGPLAFAAGLLLVSRATRRRRGAATSVQPSS